MNWLLASGSQSIGVSTLASVLLMTIQSWSPVGLTNLILQSKGLSRVFSNTTVWKHPFFVPSLLYNPTLISIQDYWTNHSFDLYGPLLLKWHLSFITLFKFVIVFLPRSRHLLSSWLQSLSQWFWSPRKVLQARLQQYVSREIPDVLAGFRKGRGTRGQIVNIGWIIEKAREFWKNICFIVLKPLTMWMTTNCGKFLKRWEYQTTVPASSETCMQVRKQELEPDMEQQTGSKLDDFVHYFASLWDECNCVVVKHSMVLPFFGFGMKNWHFPVLWSLLSLPNLLACWVPALSHFFDPG